MTIHCFSILVIGGFILGSMLTGADVKWSANVRVRMEQDTTTVATDSLYDNFSSSWTQMRSRLKLTLTENPVQFVLQLQDVRTFGEPGNAAGSTQPQTNSPVLHQAFLSVNHVLLRNSVVTLGRFEFPIARQRLFAKNNWNRNGRSFEGIVYYTQSSRLGKSHWFTLNVNERYQNYPGDVYDTSIRGVWYESISKAWKYFGLQGADFYAYQELDRTRSATRMDRRTYGLRTRLTLFFLSLEWETALQTGVDSTDTDINGHMMVTNLDISTPVIPWVEHIIFGWEQFSGDDPSSGNTREGFSNPYGAGHGYHGFIDHHKQFKTNGEPGLREWNVQMVFQPRSQVGVRIHYHQFFEYIHSQKHLGNEVDFLLTAKLANRVELSQGISQYWYGYDRDPKPFAYLVLTVTM